MTIERRLAQLFRLNSKGWERHANPMSVWSRYSVLPVFLMALWLREFSVVLSISLFVLALLWMFFNPLLFPKPKDLSSWASKAVKGEQLYLNRDKVSLPDHHQLPLYAILKFSASLGFLLSFWAAYTFNMVVCILAVFITYLAKSWFLDRMVWLYQDSISLSEKS
ncbi:MAG: hypothetical protein HWE26_03815 [Alteromonadaceae bacterium]|nr:hypothetical protein [Alteromonadaceae bacterium]